MSLCGKLGLARSGSKLELEGRIRAHLAGGVTDADVPERRATRRRTGKMPEGFELTTVIGPGWRCSPALGAYLREVCGKGFHFNAAMRELIHTGEGRTLADAAICYHASVRLGLGRRAIPRQLEFNRHFRDYFAAHPGARREEAIAAWWARRATRDGTRSDG